MNIHRAKLKRRKAKEGGKKQVWGISCCSPGGIEPCIQSTGLCEVFFTQLDQKTRMSSNAGCYITQLDSSHSLIHFSAYLYPFNSRDLTTPPPSQVGTQTRQMNNLRTEAAQLLRENKWRCMQCVKDSSELNPNQSSTYYWCNVVVENRELQLGAKIKRRQNEPGFASLKSYIIRDVEMRGNISH